MKKVIAGIFTLLLLTGIGTGVFAASDTIKCTVANFGQMLPMMKDKFPDLTVKQLKEKHNACAAQMKKTPAVDCSTMMGNNNN
jgi:hypothetical protein